MLRVYVTEVKHVADVAECVVFGNYLDWLLHELLLPFVLACSGHLAVLLCYCCRRSHNEGIVVGLSVWWHCYVALIGKVQGGPLGK